jgi:hypothetical protein
MNTRRNAPKTIPLAPTETATDVIARREALQTLLGGVGAGLGLTSVVGAQHPMHQHLANPGVVAEVQERAGAAAYQPAFLDTHQLGTLQSLAEAIVPGSTAAKVAPFLDQLLGVESQANQRAFLGALGAFDMAAVEKHRKAWTALAAAEQDAILSEASKGEPDKTALGRHFHNLKDWIAGAYYTSEPGMRELGWNGGVVHQSLPGCTHPGGHA